MKKKDQFVDKMDREVFIRYKYEILDFLLPKERWGYKKFMKKNQTAKKKWKKYLAVKVDKDVDWAVYTLGYGDYRFMKDSTTKKKLQVPTELAQEAARFALDARRKQIYLIASIIKIQSFIRMVLTRSDALHAHRSRSFQDAMRGAILIQSRTKSFLFSRAFQQKKIAIEKIQALFHGRRCKLMFSLTRSLIIKIQAFWRGCITRKEVYEVMKSRSIVYKKQILHLWEVSYTPLTYRTKFWLFINECLRYIVFAALEKELHRLWKFLEFDFNVSRRLMPNKNSILSNITFVNYIQVSA